MAKVITFSRQFPSYHPRKGEQTYFVEKFYNSLYGKNNLMDYPKGLIVDDSIEGMKWHTIRLGHRFKEGEYFSPRVWSGKPYNSKQIVLAPDVMVKKVWSFYKDPWQWKIPGTVEELSKNDGLSLVDFLDWFDSKKPFDGQIICWSDKIQY